MNYFNLFSSTHTFWLPKTLTLILMSKIATNKVSLVYMLKRHVLCKTLHNRI